MTPTPPDPAELSRKKEPDRMPSRFSGWTRRRWILAAIAAVILLIVGAVLYETQPEKDFRLAVNHLTLLFGEGGSRTSLPYEIYYDTFRYDLPRGSFGLEGSGPAATASPPVTTNQGFPWGTYALRHPRVSRGWADGKSGQLANRSSRKRLRREMKSAYALSALRRDSLRTRA